MVSGLTIGKPDDASSIADSAIATSIAFTEISRYSEVSFLKMITPCQHVCVRGKEVSCRRHKNQQILISRYRSESIAQQIHQIWQKNKKQKKLALARASQYIFLLVTTIPTAGHVLFARAVR